MLNHILTILAIAALLATVIFVIAYIIKRHLLKIEWRYYFAFKDICSTVTHRTIDDVSDMTLKEYIIIAHKFSENDFAQRQKILLERAEIDPAIKKNPNFDDKYGYVRFISRNIRRVLYVLCVIIKYMVK